MGFGIKLWLDSGYGAGLALFSEQEILSYALIPYGGSDTLLSQIGAYTNYVFLPTLPGSPPLTTPVRMSRSDSRRYRTNSTSSKAGTDLTPVP